MIALCPAILALAAAQEPETPPEIFSEADYDAVAEQVMPRDSFPVLTLPELVDAKTGSETLGDEEFVIGLDLDGETRAYPLRVMGGVELVNDVCGDLATAVSW